MRNPRETNETRLLRKRSYLALLAAGLLPVSSAWAATITYTNDGHWDLGLYASTHSGPPPAGAEGTVRLDDAILTPFNHIWVALSGRDSVVRISTDHTDIDLFSSLADSAAGNGAVLGEYLTHPDGRAGNPSRTTVDQNGDVWVGNRNEGERGLGSITKISADPLGTTSSGLWNGSTFDRLAWTNAGGADSNGGVSTAADSALLNYVRTLGANIRHVSIDASNNVWAGGGPLDAGDQVFQLYDGNTGAVVNSPGFGSFVPDNNTGGYGGLVDGNGVVWSAGLNGNTLTRFDPATGARMTVNQGGRQSYGLGIDNTGFIWNATWTNNTLDKINPDGVVVASYQLGQFGNSLRGVAVTPDNNVWVAASGSNNVIRVDNNGNVLAVIPVGVTPTGVAVDSNGKVWVTNYGSNSVMRINPLTNLVELTVDLGPGANPYNYSDMTGTVLTGTTNPQGTWRDVLDGGAGALWEQILWNTEAEGISSGLEVEARVSNDLLTWSDYNAYATGDLLGLTGRYLEVRATLSRVIGAAGPVLSDLSVLFTPGTSVPEPATLALLGASLVPLSWARRRKGA
jgi:streptogramin lyase